MRVRVSDCFVPFCCFWIISVISCARTHEPLTLDARNPSHDGRKIAAYHANQAGVFRKKAEDISEQATAYERLFGAESEWVAGARLLSQYYEEEAKGQEQLALRYRGALGQQHSQSDLKRP